MIKDLALADPLSCTAATLQDGSDDPSMRISCGPARCPRSSFPGSFPGLNNQSSLEEGEESKEWHLESLVSLLAQIPNLPYPSGLWSGGAF